MTFNIVKRPGATYCFRCFVSSPRPVALRGIIALLLAYFLAFQGCCVPKGASLPTGIPYYGLCAPLHMLTLCNIELASVSLKHGVFGEA